MSVFIQILFLSPPILSDQMEYYFTATRFPYLPVQPNHWSLRIGLILPVAVLYRIFGHAEITYYCLPFVSMTLLPIGVYFLGSKLFNRRTGFFSALWIFSIPNLMLESGQLLPDIPATACIVAGFAMLVASRDLQKNTDSRITERKTFWFLFLTGALFGWAYLIKEYYVIFVLLIPLAFWAFEIPCRNLIPVCAGFLIVFGIEAIFGLIYYDNPFIRFSTANPRETWGFIEKDALKIINYFPFLLGRYGGEGAAILGGIGVVNSFIQICRKNKIHIFLISWVLLIYCFFTLIGLLPAIFSWEDTVLLRLHKFRYWILILPPIIIAGVAAVENCLLKIFQKLKINHDIVEPLVGGLLFIFLAVSGSRGIFSVYDDPNLIRNGADHYLELRNYLEENNSPDDVIWINRENKMAFDRILPMYTRNFWGRIIWDGSFKYLNTDGLFLRAEEISFGKVIIDRYFFNPEFYPIPDYLVNPPESWKMVFESENQEIAIYSVD